MASASELFDFLDLNEEILHERREIDSLHFGSLRRSIGALIRHLTRSDDPEAVEISNSMRTLLFSWLTAPIAFDSTISNSLLSFGDEALFESRWGLCGEFKAAKRAASNMISEKSPLCDELALIIKTLVDKGRNFKIYCHRNARKHFDMLYPSELAVKIDDSSYLHSVRDYLATDPFDALIKVGPLRSKGWGAVPDAIKTAPNFRRLIQFVWSGTADDPSFGYDPVLPPCFTGRPAAPHAEEVLGTQVLWKINEIKIGSDPYSYQDKNIEKDEFISLVVPDQQKSARYRAMLLEIPAGYGILYPQTEALSFDPNQTGESAINFRIPGESFHEGMYVIQTQNDEVSLGESLAQETGYSRIWKRRLNELLESKPEALCSSLLNKGIALQNIKKCLEYWTQPPDTVIHAPQTRRHFQILIEALEIDPTFTQMTGKDIRPWWERAWDESRVSRGEASQFGREENKLIEQRKLEILRSMLTEIQKKAIDCQNFKLISPLGADICGEFVFLKVLRIEAGFSAPDTAIRIVHNLNALEQWRAV